jgi:O-acetyl-ADP-ribose deacetylase (regulator of RNase III)
MREIIYLISDATTPKTPGPKMIVHVCNDIGVWGKGFVMALSRRWSEPESQYQVWYAERKTNDFGLGGVQFVLVEADLWVANVVGQHGIRRAKEGPPIRYNAVENCLAKVALTAVELEASVHMPRIGCGLAGGKWEEIAPIITRQFCEKDIAVYVYDRG